MLESYAWPAIPVPDYLTDDKSGTVVCFLVVRMTDEGRLAIHINYSAMAYAREPVIAAYDDSAAAKHERSPFGVHVRAIDSL